MFFPMLTSDNPSLSAVRMLAIASKRACGLDAYLCKVVHDHPLFVSIAKYLIWSPLGGIISIAKYK